MRVALIVPGGVDRSGTDRVIPAFLWLIERLAQRHDVHVFATRQEQEPGDWELLGAHVHNIGMAQRTTRRLLSRFGAEHFAQRFDVVHALFGWSGAQAALVGWRYRVPVLFHATGGEFVGLKDIGYGMQCTLRERLAVKLALRGATRVSVPSAYMQRIAKAHGVHAAVVPLGVALNHWPTIAPRAHGTSAPLRLLHIGDARPVKNHEMLMDVAARLRDMNVDFQLDVAGLNTQTVAIELAAARGLGAIVRGHGVLDRASLRKLVNEADLLLVTSHHEAEPLVVLEAAIAGVPTVGTAVGHIATWAPSAAVSVAVGDAAGMAAAIRALISNDARRLSIAEEAQRRALEIDADYTAREFERIYAEMARPT